MLLALVAIYVVSVTARTLLHGTSVTAFEILQVAAAAVLAIAGALRISHGAGPWPVLVAGSCLLFAAGCYAAAFTGLASDRNFHVYATFALLLALIGGALFTSSAAFLWIALALAAAAYRPSNTLAAHAAVYLTAAASASGLLLYSAAQLTGTALRGGGLNAASIFCALAIPAAYALLRGPKHRGLEWMRRIPSALAAALLCWVLAGLAAGLVLRARIDPSWASTARTAVLSVTAIAMAWFGNRKALRELIWLLFPWMIFIAAKLLAEDFQQGRSSTLFVSLLLYGGTLIALPRLLRRDSMRA